MTVAEQLRNDGYKKGEERGYKKAEQQILLHLLHLKFRRYQLK